MSPAREFRMPCLILCVKDYTGNPGSCVDQNKYPVQDDEYSYRDILQACLVEGISHLVSAL